MHLKDAAAVDVLRQSTETVKGTGLWIAVATVDLLNQARAVLSSNMRLNSDRDCNLAPLAACDVQGL